MRAATIWCVTPLEVDTDLLPLRLWLKAGQAEVLLEHWLVRQRANQISTSGQSPKRVRPSR
jgi:hypothetical protein